MGTAPVDTEYETIEFERENKPMGMRIRGIGVREDGTTEELDSVTVGSERDFDRIQQFKQHCRERHGC